MHAITPHTLRPKAPAPPALPADSAAGFLLQLARALHAAGAPSYRLEAALERCAAGWGEAVEFYSTPTSLFASFGSDVDQRTYLLRVEPGDADLGRLSDLDELMERVSTQELTPAEGLEALRRLDAQPARYGPWATWISFASVSGTAAVFFGGGPLEVGFSVGLGGLIGGLALMFRRAGLLEMTAACLASALSVLLAHLVPGVSDRVITLAALIVLVPGLTLTVGLSEVSLGHWMSGTSRLAGAAAAFLSIALGVALGRRTAALLPGFVSSDGTASPGTWAILGALCVATPAFTVLFRARRRDVGWILLACLGGFFGSRLGAQVLGPELGSFVGALALGVGGNVFARLRRRPASVLQVPGLLLLVPGSIGFESLSSFLAQDVLQGVDAFFRVLFVGVSLVGGLFLSNALVPPMRSL